MQECVKEMNQQYDSMATILAKIRNLSSVTPEFLALTGIGSFFQVKEGH